jgi:hypothetical protein
MEYDDLKKWLRTEGIFVIVNVACVGAVKETMPCALDFMPIGLCICTSNWTGAEKECKPAEFPARARIWSPLKAGAAKATDGSIAAKART